jgi:hypothetical protein
MLNTNHITKSYKYIYFLVHLGQTLDKAGTRYKKRLFKWTIFLEAGKIE